MSTILLYLVKSAFYLAGFYLVYSFLLSKDTLYSRNRVFILASILFAIVLPLITIQTSKPVNIGLFGKTLSEVLVRGKSGLVNGSEVKGAWNFSKILSVIYLAGFLLFGCKLLSDLLEVVFLIIRRKEKDTKIIRFNGLNTAGFSALGYVFIRTGLSPDETKEVIKHEQNHLYQHHFMDIIFIETVSVVQWFNPFIHLFNRSLRAVHEYQADESCLKAGVPVVNYQRLIMNLLFQSKAFTLTNSFSNPTLIKKRMIMMTKKRSGMLANLKVLMVLPVIAIVLIAFSSCKGKTKPVQGTTEEIAPPPPPPPPQSTGYSDQKVIPGQATAPNAPPPPPPPPFQIQNGDTTWVVVDQMPLYHGGDTAILGYIGRNTKYPEKAKANNIQGRVVVRFVITKEGKMSNVEILKSVSPELNEEALRVVKSLPGFERPGFVKGKPVAVWYRVPIAFTLK